eukprot:5327655-Pleurochrysis_carterae.AAC.1
MPSVGGMLKKVFGPGVTSGAEERRRSINEHVCLQQFALVCGWYVREPSNVVAVADGRWSAIRN